MSDDDVVDASWAIQKGGGMSERESWTPSDKEIREVLVNMGGILDFASFSRIVRALIRTAVKRALAEQEARHKREVVKARLEAERHTLGRFGYNGKGVDSNDIRVREIDKELAALEVKP